MNPNKACKNLVSPTLVFLVLMMGMTTVYANPEIQSTSGAWSHSGVVTIAGSNFGSKTPAAPRLWDPTDDSSPNDLNTFYPLDTWPDVCDGTSGDPPYLMAYRTSFHGFSEMPHGRITKFLSAAATTCSSAGSGGIRGWDTDWANNLVTFPWNSDKLFLMYYYRVSPTFSKHTTEMGGQNMKEISVQEGNTYFSGNFAYRAFCETPPSNFPNDAAVRGGPDSCSSVNRISLTNPMHRWIHMEWLWDSSNFTSFSYSDNNSRVGSKEGTRRFSSVTPASVSLGGFLRWPRESVTGNYRFWAGVYADDTYARVMVGNNPDWDSCIVREPQIPSEWSDTSITVTVNLGALRTCETGYLFVFDEDNNHNAVGYPVSLLPTTGEPCDPQNLSAPQNLRVVP